MRFTMRATERVVRRAWPIAAGRVAWANFAAELEIHKQRRCGEALIFTGGGQTGGAFGEIGAQSLAAASPRGT